MVQIEGMKASNNHFLNKYSGLKPTLVFRSNTYFLVNSTQPYTGLQKGYHSNKQLKYSFCYEDGKLCRTELYDGNGQLRKKANYKDGQLHGEYEKYDRNSQLRKKANYKDGRLHGEYEKYHGNGHLKEKANYIDGLLHGEYEKYHRNGHLKEKANYIDGIKQFVLINFIKTCFRVALLIGATILTFFWFAAILSAFLY